MAESFEKIEVDIEILHKARQKFDKCDHRDKFYEHGYCRLFHYTMDRSIDMLAYCGSCRANKGEPSSKTPVRSS